MTTTTSPAPTVSPAATLISLTVPAFSAVIWFSIFIASSTHDRLTDLDGLADLDEHLHDRALHRHRRRCPAAGRRAAAADGRGRLLGGLAGARRGDRRGDVGHPQLHGEALAVDLDVDVALDQRRRRRRRRGAGAGGAATPLRSSVSSTHLVECSRRRSRGGARIARSAGIVVATPSTTISSSARIMRAMAVGAVLAPHDELADEVVVVLADVVAGLVAAVPAHAEAVGRRRSLVIVPGRGQELAAGRVLGVDADLDRVAAPRPSTSSCVNDSGSPDGDADLLLDEVDAGDHLGDGVLDLEPGVHLEEEELAVLVEELDGAGVA